MVPDVNPDTGIPLDIGIHDIDGRGDAKNSDGFFEKGVTQALESDHNAGSKLKEVKVISNGHCHGTTKILFFFVLTTCSLAS